MSEETVTFNLEIDVSRTYDNVRKLETLLFRSLGLARRLGLPEEISQQIYLIQRLIMVIRMAHTAMIAFEAASGPYGWALATIGIVSAGVSLVDTIDIEARTH